MNTIEWGFLIVNYLFEDVTMLHAGSIPCGWSFGEGQNHAARHRLVPVSNATPNAARATLPVRVARTLQLRKPLTAAAPGDGWPARTRRRSRSASAR